MFDLLQIVITPLTIISSVLILVVFGREIVGRSKSVNIEAGPVKFQAHRDDERASQNRFFTAEENFPGYIFINTPEDQKKHFYDAFVGFDEFAKLRGYSVSISVETSIEGKIGFKITLSDTGVTVSTARVKQDVEDYVMRIRDGGNFDDLPMLNDPIEHQKILTALKMRFSLMQHEIELKSLSIEAYKALISGIGRYPEGAIGYAPASMPPFNQNIHLVSEGATAMTNDRTANQSPGAVLGDHSEAKITNSNINIGSTVSEQATRMRDLEELLQIVEESDLEKNDKKDVGRYLENTKEELDSSEADKGRIEQWLGKAKRILSIAEKGSALADKAAEVFEKFGMSGS